MISLPIGLMDREEIEPQVQIQLLAASAVIKMALLDGYMMSPSDDYLRRTGSAGGPETISWVHSVMPLVGLADCANG
jgi:hypothetical protein